MKKLIILVVLMILFGVGVGLCAMLPYINLQGRLIDNATGIAVKGTKSATFKVYNKDGLSIWSETKDITADNDGFFNVALGTNIPANPIFTTDILNSAHSIEVTIGTSIYSKQSILPVMFSMRSAVSDLSFNTYAFNGYSINSFVTKDASAPSNDLFVKKSGDSMGGQLSITTLEKSLNTTSTSTAYSIPMLSVSGIGKVPNGAVNFGAFGRAALVAISRDNTGVYGESLNGYGGYFVGPKGVKIEGSLEVTKSISAETIKASTFILNGYQITTWPSGAISPWNDSTNYLYYYKGGATEKVGIGVMTPASMLGVRTGVSIGDGYVYYKAPSRGLLVEGNVGIGTTAPVSKVDIVGGINVNNSSGDGMKIKGTTYGIKSNVDFGSTGAILGVSGNGSTTDLNYGVAGISDHGNGVYGKVDSDSLDNFWKAGVQGVGGAKTAGVIGSTSSLTRAGVVGYNSNGYSGYFEGGEGVKIEGKLKVTGGITGKIDNLSLPKDISIADYVSANKFKKTYLTPVIAGIIQLGQPHVGDNVLGKGSVGTLTILSTAVKSSSLIFITPRLTSEYDMPTHIATWIGAVSAGSVDVKYKNISDNNINATIDEGFLKIQFMIVN